MILCDMNLSIDAEDVFDSLERHQQEDLLIYAFGGMHTYTQKAFLHWLFDNYEDLIDEVKGERQGEAHRRLAQGRVVHQRQDTLAECTRNRE